MKHGAGHGTGDKGGDPSNLKMPATTKDKSQSMANKAASGGEGGKVPHAVGARLGEGQVLAAPGGRHGRIVDGEVADMQLIDAQVRRRRQAKLHRGD